MYTFVGMFTTSASFSLMHLKPWYTPAGIFSISGLWSPMKNSFTIPRVSDSSRASKRTTFIIPLTTTKWSSWCRW